MGIGYGLIQGLTGAARGINQGKADARELERQAKEAERKALHDALAQKLMEAQINKMNAPPPLAKPETPETAWTDEGLVQYNTKTGGWEPAAIGGKQIKAPPKEPSREPRVPMITLADGTRGPDVVGARPQEDRRAPSAAEVAAQDQMPLIEESYNALEEIEARDPKIGNRVIAKANQARQFSLGRVGAGIIGKLSGTRSDEDQKALTEQAIINSLTPEEARWYAASKGYLSGVLPALGGKSLTINEIISHGSPMFSTGEESDESLAQKRAARRARYEATRRRAGVPGNVPQRPGPMQPQAQPVSARARALAQKALGKR